MLRKKNQPVTNEQAHAEADTPFVAPGNLPETVNKPGTPITPRKSRIRSGITALNPKNFPGSVRRHPRRTIAASIVLLAVLVLLAVPATRYKTLGMVIKKPVQVRVVNSKSKLAVSEASVTINGTEAKTDANGVAYFNAVPVGSRTAAIKKTYYTEASVPVFVGLGKSKQTTASISATGQPVSVIVLNSITKKPVGNATISIGNEKYITKNDGKAQVLLASDAKESKASVDGDGFNKTDVTITAIGSAKADPKNTFTLTPSGKIYFLSKRTGKINVMKSNLDGTDAQVVVQGTGNEDEGDTILLASRDWKYLALKAKRDTKNDFSTLYVIDTADNDKLIPADEGNVSFTLAGWKDNTLVYSIDRLDLENSQSGKLKIKSFDAHSKKLTTLEQNVAEEGNRIYQSYGTVYLTDKGVVYGTNWYCYAQYCDTAFKRIGLYSVNVDGSNKKTLADYDAQNSNFSYVPYELNGFYLLVNKNWYGYTASYFEYDSEKGTVEPKELTSTDFYKYYPTPIISPSSKNTLWTDQRDGKSIILIGDKDGENEKQVASLDDSWSAYGWYSDDYLLVSKKGSELFIMPVSGGTNAPVKITDYHKASYNFSGYGGGYGGF